jgi:hypothetical protein
MWIAEIDAWSYRNRIYNQKLGRFLQTDPIGQAGGLNLYAYVGNDPVNLIDPWGFNPYECENRPDGVRVCGKVTVTAPRRDPPMNVSTRLLLVWNNLGFPTQIGTGTVLQNWAIGKIAEYNVRQTCTNLGFVVEPNKRFVDPNGVVAEVDIVAWRLDVTIDPATLDKELLTTIIFIEVKALGGRLSRNQRIVYPAITTGQAVTQLEDGFGPIKGQVPLRDQFTPRGQPPPYSIRMAHRFPSNGVGCQASDIPS